MTAALGAALTLSACGTEAAGDGADPSSADRAAPAAGGADDTDSTDSDSDSDGADDADTPVVSSRSGDDLAGEVLLNERLDVNPANAPIADVPYAGSFADVAELASAYANVPGIAEIAAQLEATTLGADDRLLAYITTACTTEDVSLAEIDDSVTMVVSGTATIRCATPPSTLVVWSVSADQVPADLEVGQAIQK